MLNPILQVHIFSCVDVFPRKILIHNILFSWKPLEVPQEREHTHKKTGQH
jgi:hypothetical protein